MGRECFKYSEKCGRTSCLNIPLKFAYIFVAVTNDGWFNLFHIILYLHCVCRCTVGITNTFIQISVYFPFKLWIIGLGNKYKTN